MTKTLEERAAKVAELAVKYDKSAVFYKVECFYGEEGRLYHSSDFYVHASAMAKLIADQQARIQELEAQKDGAYSERNRLVAALSKLFPSWIEWHSEEDTTWDNDWRNIVYINLPTGQVSWHIQDGEIDHFQHLTKKVGSSWDGHTTDEKYKRLSALAEKKIPYLEALLDAQRGRILDLTQRIHYAKEVYIGMDGFKPETAPEGYCLKLLKDIYEELCE